MLTNVWPLDFFCSLLWNLDHHDHAACWCYLKCWGTYNCIFNSPESLFRIIGLGLWKNKLQNNYLLLLNFVIKVYKSFHILSMIIGRFLSWKWELLLTALLNWKVVVLKTGFWGKGPRHEIWHVLARVWKNFTINS